MVKHHWLILALAVSSAVTGGWELVVTRTASVLFYYDLAYVILAVCLLAIGLGALSTRHFPHRLNISVVVALLLVSPVMTWPLLYYFEIAWIAGVFTMPFLLFGAVAALVWEAIDDLGSRTRLYAAELLGAIFGLVLLGPMLASWLPVNVLGDIGVDNHLKVTISREGLVRHEHVTNAYARTDLIETQQSAIRYVFTDGMFVTRSVQWDGKSDFFSDPQAEKLATLKRFALRTSELGSVALLGAGAGFDVAVSLQARAGEIDAVEVNPVTIEIAEQLDDWAGGGMSHPNVNIHITDARRFMQRSSRQWDHINLTLLQTSPASTRGRQHIDARVLTLEAIQLYLSRLNEYGVVSIIQNTPELAAATVQTIEPAIPESANRILRFQLTGEAASDNPFSHLIVVRNEPFSTAEIEQLKALATNSDIELIPPDARSLSGRPATDDRPYLFESGTVVSTQSALVSLLVLLFMAAWLVGNRRDPAVTKLGLLSATIGACAMAVQLIAVYRCQSAIGSPVMALGVAIASVLGGAGIGTLFFGRQLRGRISWSMTGLLAATGTALFVTLSPWIVDRAIGADDISAIFILATFIGLCTLPLGLPFVATINQATHLAQPGAGVVIGFDGIGSILGATAATLIAVTAGFTALGILLVCGFLVFAMVIRLGR
jgi:hypothetical protein